MRSLIRILLLTAWIPVVAVAEDDAKLREILQLGASFQANKAFAMVPEWKKGADPRKYAYVRGFLLLNVQPKTSSNVDEAIALFQEVTKENPKDDLAVMARFFEARCYQVHKRPAQLDKAQELFLKLFEEHPEHAFAQLAFSKYLAIRTFGSGEPVTKEWLDEQAKRGETINDPAAKRIFFGGIGTVYSRMGISRENSIEYTRKNLDANFANIKARSHLLYKLSQVEEKAGNWEESAKFCRMFIEEFQRDDRVYDVQQRLKRMEERLSESGSKEATP